MIKFKIYEGCDREGAYLLMEKMENFINESKNRKLVSHCLTEYPRHVKMTDGWVTGTTVYLSFVYKEKEV